MTNSKDLKIVTKLKSIFLISVSLTNILSKRVVAKEKIIKKIIIHFQLKIIIIVCPKRGATIGTNIKMLIIKEFILANLFPENRSLQIA